MTVVFPVEAGPAMTDMGRKLSPGPMPNRPDAEQIRRSIFETS
jgi:hypothetical protein